MHPEDTTIRIPLTRGHDAVIDKADHDLVKSFHWVALSSGRRTYAVCREGGGYLLMHRLITGAPDGLDVDHVDGDGLNNTRKNLRACSRSENIANTPRRSNNRSGFKGVSWHRGARKWRATIRQDGKQRHLGFFSDAKDAARAYDEVARELWGHHAYVNFPECP